MLVSQSKTGLQKGLARVKLKRAICAVRKKVAQLSVYQLLSVLLVDSTAMSGYMLIFSGFYWHGNDVTTHADSV